SSPLISLPAALPITHIPRFFYVRLIYKCKKKARNHLKQCEQNYKTSQENNEIFHIPTSILLIITIHKKLHFFKSQPGFFLYHVRRLIAARVECIAARL